MAYSDMSPTLIRWSAVVNASNRSRASAGSAASGPPQSGTGGRQTLVEHSEREVDLVCRRHERWDDPDDVHVGPGGQDDQLAGEGFRLDALRDVRVRHAAVALAG